MSAKATPAEDETSEEEPVIELSYDAAVNRSGHLEAAIKERMASILPMITRATQRGEESPFVDEYVSLARTLRQLVEQQDRQRRVPLLDYPTDGGVLWEDLDVEPDFSDGWSTHIAYRGE